MAHYHWSWQFLHWGIRWPIVQRILIDAPSYQSAGGGQETKKTNVLSTANMQKIMEELNSQFS